MIYINFLGPIYFMGCHKIIYLSPSFAGSNTFIRDSITKQIIKEPIMYS